MAFRITRKELLNSFPNVRSAGYCRLYYLLRNHRPIAYAARIYGWNYDVYSVYGVTIATGYRSMPGTPLEGVTEFEKKAEELILGSGFKADPTDAIENLLKEFCKLNGGY